MVSSNWRLAEGGGFCRLADERCAKQVLEELLALPVESDPRFEFRVTEWVQHRRGLEEDALTQEALRQVLEDEAQPVELRFKAFYALHIRLRRLKEHCKLRELMEGYGPDFQDRPLYPHLQSLAAKQRRADLTQALQLAEDARRKAPQHPGVLHNYAETVAQIEEVKDNPNTTEVQAALEAVEGAIARARQVRDRPRREYAKYFATKGRLLALLGRFEEAVTAVEQAVDVEDPSQEDYSLRLGEYHDIRERVLFRQYLTRVRQSLAEAKSRMEEDLHQLKGNMIELMGLLAAVIAFLVGGTQVVRQEGGAVRLMVALTGAILVTYAGFGALFHTALSWRRIAFVLVLGFVLLVYAFASSRLPGCSALTWDLPVV